MPAYNNTKKTRQYTNEFKAQAVKLTLLSGVSVKGVAESFGPAFHVIELAQRVSVRKD